MFNSTSRIQNIEFPGYLINAAVPSALAIADIKKMTDAGSAGILIKSCTLEPREGNPEPRYVDLPMGSLNSIGLANPGYLEYKKYLAELRDSGYEKPLVISVAGFSATDYRLLTEAFQDSAADLIELNLSCPNVEGGKVIGYDFVALAEIVKQTRGLGSKLVGYKLPPYPDAGMIKEVSEIMLEHKADFIVSTNTLGNSLAIDADTESVMMKAGNGFGGLAGKYIKPIALGNVRRFYEAFKGEIPIIGSGGIYSGRDVFEFLLAGADLVEIGTAFYQQGTGLFAQINEEFKAIMESKNYENIEAAKGNLKFL
ncbi:dihydroorotate oxidase [Candidatus Gracilibacteria bacterium]|jgi:dihydroorotate dehydrogenase (fumarate)|nr:dihydroorotate oxidase [Candidatus Gracilibacteria bacterium]